MSMVRVTSAKPCAFRWGVPPKMTSSILEQRRVRTDCSPSTQRIASLMLLLPLPFGPTTEVMPRSKVSVVLSGKVLNPCSSKDFKIMYANSSQDGRDVLPFQVRIDLSLNRVSRSIH